MRLRILKLKDAPYMLEWMRDDHIIKNFQMDFAKKKLPDCEEFIKISWADTINLHMAVVDDNDTYMGTVSLKHIDKLNQSAEFAIVVRACAMGKGFSKFAMKEIIRKGMEELGLNKIYWCVSKENKRAIQFYDKNGYQRVNQLLLKLSGGVQYFTNQILFMVSPKEINYGRRAEYQQKLNIKHLFPLLKEAVYRSI